METPFFPECNLPPEPQTSKAANVDQPSSSPRLRLAERHQIEMHCLSLDQMLPPDHEARVVWRFVQGLDLTALLNQIQATAGKPGRDANDPRILLSLWLYATTKGIGSARELNELCAEHTAYRWLCGGVSMNYHTLADFRSQHVDVLDNLLTQSVAALLHEGLIDLERVAQDGMRVRASAGAASFRRKPTLEKCYAEAKEQVAALKTQLDEEASSASLRQQKARQRAAQERLERIEKALQEREQLAELKEQQRKEKGVKYKPEELRASTTDPVARRMKMPDGGTRPGYNIQFSTTTRGGAIAGVAVTNSGSDSGQLPPMTEQLKTRYGKAPDESLVDGGFTTLEDIEKVHEKFGTKVYGPIKDEEKKKEQGIDPYQPRKKDGPGVAAWRQRMGTEEAKTIYRQRAQTAEWVNAGARSHSMYQVRVRGIQKVLAVALLCALAHNLQRTETLRKQAQAETNR